VFVDKPVGCVNLVNTDFSDEARARLAAAALARGIDGLDLTAPLPSPVLA